MIKKYFLFIIISVFAININAQEEDIEFKSIKNNLERPTAIFKLSLLSQLDINSPSLQLGLELKLSKLIGIHQELGYVNYWFNPIYVALDQNFSQVAKNKNGLKYILEPRFYLFDKEKLFSSRIFFAPSLDFRYVVIQKKEWVSLNNNAYRRKMKYNIQRLAYGINAKFGFTTSIKKKIPIEMAIGIGARYVTLKNSLPDNSTISSGNSNNFLFPRPRIEGEFWTPSVYFGMLMHLPIKK